MMNHPHGCSTRVSQAQARRRFGQRTVTVLLCLGLAAYSLGTPPRMAAAAAPRPNIVLIIADDLGCEDCQPYGNRAVRTPNLARLAREGMRFDRAFLTCSSCSPSRSSLITSRYPHNTGAAELHQPLPKEQITFVERLRSAGYWTAAAGKWHLGPAVKDRFDHIAEAGGKLPEGVRRDGSGCELWLPTLAQRPLDKPFFLWLAAIDPHRDYASGAVIPPHRPEDVVVPPYYPDTPATRRDLALYYDEIARLDTYVGRVLDFLADQQLADRTLVLFMTDNGRPFPRCKTTVYDGGIRTPLLARWPGRIRAGAVCDSLISSIDIGPTLIELSGASSSDTFQGISFARLFTNPRETIREFVFAEHNWHDFRAHERAVRTRNIKLIVNRFPELPGTPPADAVRGATYQDMRRLWADHQLDEAQRTVFVAPRAPEELYDLTTDPHELNNVAEDPRYSVQLKRLRIALANWSRQTQDRPPKTFTPDKFDRLTGEPLAEKP